MGSRSPFRSLQRRVDSEASRMKLLFRYALIALTAGIPLSAASQSPPPTPPTSSAGLRLMAAQAVRALLVDDGSRLPKAAGFRYTENGQPLAIGDGMWGTLTAVAG